MKGIQISVVIITFNEERNIARCLSSVKEIADDIVVVDSYSKDSTAAICEKLGARFVQHKFDGHIEQKNWAITQAKFPYVLSLDADECLDEQLKKSILEVKENWNFDAYEMNRLTNYCGKFIRHCGWYPDKKLRLWDSRKGKWGGTNPHDKYELMDRSAKVGNLKGDLLHYSFYTVEEHYNQAKKFSEIAAIALYKQGRRANYGYIYFSPLVRFINDYIFKAGFLDGAEGFIISKMAARYTYNKYRQLLKIQNGEIKI
jgi:glycosyltransferase involved in cell wall biosynthesis